MDAPANVTPLAGPHTADVAAAGMRALLKAMVQMKASDLHKLNALEGTP